MSSSQIAKRTAEIEAELIRPVSEKWAALNAKLLACPGRDDNGPHLPRFGPETTDMHCTYCGEALVVV